MKVANIAEFKNHLREYLAAVAAGEEVEIRKRNVPLARGADPVRLPDAATRILTADDTRVCVSAIGCAEIACASQRG
ncbi:MAG: type II toxin-antitoxin system prevent-host-death family antitoxin [Acidobacteria bacterium]|nr:type II toxin-antitoxin system prevent-host-death family antitoxin [Acidobacteriota bacterium]